MILSGILIPFPQTMTIGLVDASGAPLSTRSPEVQDLLDAAQRFDQGFRELGLLPPFSRPIVWPPGHRERMEQLWAELEATGTVGCSKAEKEQLAHQLREYSALRHFLDPVTPQVPAP